MRLTIVSPFPPAITGIGQYGYHVSQMLERSDAFAKITVLTGHNGSSPHTASSQLEIRQGWPSGQWDISPAIIKNMQRTKPDLVWFNLGVSAFGSGPLVNLSGFLSVLQFKRSGIPTVVTLHEIAELTDLRALKVPGGVFARLGAKLFTYIATRGDVTCLTMQRYTDWLSKQYSNGQFVHIPLGAYDAPTPLPESDVPELLLFTTLAPFKGVELLIKAFRSLKADTPELKLTIAGAEHNRFPGYLDKLHKKYNDLDGIRWLGEVPESDIRTLFQRATLVVLPYQATTGSSSVLWQAAMYGRAVVTSDLDAIRSAVSDAGLEVTYVTPNHVDSLTKSIGAMLADPALRRSQVETNLNAVQRFGPKKTCQAYLNAFNLALEMNHSSRRLSENSPPEGAF